MSVRLNCRACRTAFLVPDELAGRPVSCPKCDAGQVAAPGAVPVPDPPTPRPPSLTGPVRPPADDPEAPESSTFVPAPAPRRPRRSRRVVAVAMLLLLIAAVAALVAWPSIRDRVRPEPVDLASSSPPARHPRPEPAPARPALVAPAPAPPAGQAKPEPPRRSRRLDPAESAAASYLQARVDRDEEAARRLGTVAEAPSIAAFRDARRDPDRDAILKGSFAPISALHARIDSEYAYDPKIGRFTPRNALGQAADTLDALHDAKDKAKKGDLYAKIAGGTPDDLFDAAEQLGSVYANLAETVLAPKKLIPTYKHLVEGSKPPLPAPESALALDYAEHRAAWDDLLGRPFLSLRSDGPFALERAEVSALVAEPTASQGDALTPLRLELTRFRLDGIDTGWKVTGVRRDAPPTTEHSPGRTPE